MNSSNVQQYLTQYTQLIRHYGEHRYNARLLQSLVSNFELNVLQVQRSMPVKPLLKLWLQLLFTRTTVELKGSVQPSQVVLWPVQFIHLDFLIPVYRSLKSMGTSAVFIGNRPEMQALVEEVQAPYIAIKQHTQYGLFASAFKRGWNMLHLLFTVRKLFPNDRVMRKAVLRTVINFRYYELYDSIYPMVKQTIQPGYHLWGYEFSVACRPLNILANADKLPSGNIQHGAINNNLLPLSICHNQFVWDYLTADILEQTNPTTQVYVTGSPGSKHRDPQPVEHKELVSFLDAHSHNLLVCFSGPGHNVTETGHLENLTSLQTHIASQPQIGFVIKLHNKDKRTYYESILHLKNVYLIDHQHELFKQSILDLINSTDGVLTGASTVAIEALLAAKPVISMDLKQELGHIAFLQTPLIVKCTHSSALNAALSEFASPTPASIERLQAIQRFSEQHRDLRPEAAAIRIAQIIQQQLSVCAA